MRVDVGEPVALERDVGLLDRSSTAHREPTSTSPESAQQSDASRTHRSASRIAFETIDGELTAAMDRWDRSPPSGVLGARRAQRGNSPLPAHGLQFS
ncbi:hypothetical protein [Streptomyces sp. NPDC001743]|uniref:hypothetical protein n=1 Tax=Streptomyces sp. NPDC001743 TaxID=3154397 RepID=UPI00331A182B